MADKSTTLPILDHVIILVSYQDLQALPQKLEGSLTVIDGGAHADGLTVNKLVIFPDGFYLEFIAFRDDADPDGRKAHQWGSLEEGAIVDWAYTLRDESEFAGVQKRVREASDPAVGVWYKDPVPGGRTRPDGVELKWAVSFSRDAAGKPLWPGTVPFWCFDRTPRHNRVPYHDNETGAAPAYTKHASGAVGVSRVSVTVPVKEFLIISQAYEGVHGAAIDRGAERIVWPWAVHSGSDRGKRRVSLGSTSAGTRHIELTFVGDEASPESIELLPGLTVNFDR